jgi:hypothetical protein
LRKCGRNARHEQCESQSQSLHHNLTLTMSEKRLEPAAQCRMKHAAPREGSVIRMSNSQPDAPSHSRDTKCVRVLRQLRPSKSRGRRECRVHAAPTALRANEKDAREANTGTPKSLRHSLRNGFTAAPRSPRGTGLASPRHSIDHYRQSLIPASGDQDHTA